MTDRMRSSGTTVLFWSGGKDSALALDELNGTDRVSALLTTYDEVSGRVAFQALSIGAVRLQAKAVGLPLIEVALPPEAPNEVYVERVLDALEREADESVAAVGFGDVFLEDIRAWREQMFRNSPYRTTFPLWGSDSRELAQRFVADGFRAVVSCVDTRALPADRLGQAYDANFIDSLPEDVDPCGERGEFHTVVWDGPLFVEPLDVDLWERSTSGVFCSVEVNASE